MVSAYQTNSYLLINGGFINMIPRMYNQNTCDCMKAFTCTEQNILIINNTIAVVPGWYMGCYIIDSLLQATLECYYNQACIDSIYAAYQFWAWGALSWDRLAPRPRPLNATRATRSRFPPNVTLRDILVELLVDDWHVKTNFEAYYKECQPTQCSYTERIRRNFISGVTMFIALLGGLITTLDILVPNTVRFLRGPALYFFKRVHAKICQRRARVSTVATITY